MRHAHPITAAIYDRVVESTERAFLSALRARLLEAAQGKVLEIGAGTGRNFPHYSSSAITEIIAVEPDPYMRRRAEARVAAVGPTIVLTEGIAESLPVPNRSIDTIVSTLVLCSVDDPESVVREWRRVLKPRGAVLLIEHLRSEHPRRAWFQDLITPVWRRIAANCHPNRETLSTIGQGGFNFQESERLDLGAPWIQPIVAGVATPR